MNDTTKENTEMKVSSVDMANDKLQQQLIDAQVKYPAWKPSKQGAILAGEIVDVRDFPYMHEGKGAIVATIKTGLKGDDEYVAFWLNTVAVSELLKLRNSALEAGQNPVLPEAEFAEKAEALKEMFGEEIIIQYNGEKKPEGKGKTKFSPYQLFKIIRNKA